MAEHNKDPDELDELFKTFDRQHAEVQQKLLEVEKNLQEFRRERSGAGGETDDSAGSPAGEQQGGE